MAGPPTAIGDDGVPLFKYAKRVEQELRHGR
jgi:hypothetical protein